MRSFVITKCARRATRISAVGIKPDEKATANRRNRRKMKRELKARGENGDFTPILFTGWDVI